MSDPGILTLSFEENDIAVLTLDDPRKGANVLSTPVLEEFCAALRRARSGGPIWPGW